MIMQATYHPSSNHGLLKKALLWMMVFAAVATAHAQYTATVDLNTKYQKFEGWGTSLAWWANVVGGFPDTNRNEYVNKFFDPVTGLGLNVVRYNIGGGENPSYLPPNNTYLQYRARVPGFLSSSSASYDWTQDANQRWVLQQSIQKGVTIEEAFSNSPPYWMTNSGSVTGAKDGGNNLNPSDAGAFADYLASVVQHYHDTWGITFRTLEPFNEPSANWWKFGGGQEGAGFNRSVQDPFVKTLGAALATRSMSYTSVSASDENSIDDAVLSLNAMDSTAMGYIGQVNTHSYNGSERSQLLSAATAANKRLWMSEYGDGDATGMTTATQIVKDLKTMQPTSWIYWQAVDSSGGWGFMNNALDGSSNYSYVTNEKYYVMGNFKFIRPGYQFVDINDSNSIAAFDGNGTLVIVTVSNSSTDQEVSYSIPSLANGPWTVTAYRTSASENLARQSPFTLSSASFTRLIPANSVTTFVITSNSLVPIVDGEQYYIFAKWSSDGANISDHQLLEVPGWSTDIGKQLDVWGYSYDENNNNWPGNQMWTAHSALGSNWVFTNVKSGLAMDINGTSAGSPVIQNTVTDNVSQVWAVVPVGDGTFRIVNAQTGLDVKMVDWWGKGVVQDVDPGAGNWADNVHWTFMPYQGGTFTTQLTMSTYTTPVLTTATEKLSATISSNSPNAPTGSVTFYDGTTALGKVTSWGKDNVATLSLNAGSLSVGTHYITAVYSGDSHNDSSSTPEIAIEVDKPVLITTSTALTSSLNPATQSQTVKFTASISGAGATAPTGNMIFMAGGTQLGTVPVNGTSAVLSTNTLTPGVYSMTATYSGDIVYDTSSSGAILQTIDGQGSATTTTTLAASPAAPIAGSTITLSGKVASSSGTPTGNLYVLEGAAIVGSAPLDSSGSASLNTTNLGVGTHTLSAFYGGDATFAPSTSASVSVKVYDAPQGDYAIAARDSQLKLDGSQVRTSISIATSGGFNQPVSLSCSGLPAGYSCFFSPATLTPTGSGAAVAQLIIGTSATASVRGEQSSRRLVTALAGVCFFGLPFWWRFRRNLKSALLMLVLMVSLGLSISGCSSTKMKTYDVVVTGTSLPLSHSVTIQLQQ